MILTSHPSGNANVRQLALALHDQGLLAGIATGLALRSEPSAALPASWRRQLARRRWPEPVAPLVLSDPLPELLRLGLSQLPPLRGSGWPNRLVNWQARHHDLQVARRLRHWRGSSRLRAFYGYEDSACRSLQQARSQGLRTFLELPTLHATSVRRFQAQEAARQPHSSPLLPALREPAWKRRRKQAELVAADWIVVPSTLVRDSCVEAGIEASKLLVVPYGAPAPSYPQRDANQPPIALYVGRLTPAKGLDHLLTAWRLLDLAGAQLWLAGACSYPQAWLEHLPPTVRWLGSLPQRELAAVYAKAQLLVLPSLVDGYPMVVSEAMAMGLPVLLTDRCGNRDLIEHGLTGWQVPAADPDSLAACLHQALNDPAQAQTIGAAARDRVSRYGWADYRRTIAALIAERL